jgi:hypothetical protein
MRPRPLLLCAAALRALLLLCCSTCAAVLEDSSTAQETIAQAYAPNEAAALYFPDKQVVVCTSLVCLPLAEICVALLLLSSRLACSGQPL